MNTAQEWAGGSEPNPEEINVLAHLRICFVAGTLVLGGAERQLYYMVRALVKNGASVLVAAMFGGGYWEEPLRELGATVIEIRPYRPRLLRLFNLIRTVRKYHPHIVQSQQFYTNAYASITARLIRAIDIGAVRNTGKYDITISGPIGGLANLKMPRVIVANSRTALKFLVGRGVPPERLEFLPNVVDTDYFHPADVEPVARRSVRILAVGRLVTQKGFDKLLAAFAQLHRDLPDLLHLRIVGDGHEQSNLRRIADLLDLPEELVEFCRATPDIVPHYHWADIFVLTSYFEGTPNVVLEAMSCGLPVVATNVGDVSYIIDHGKNGFVVQSRDTDELCQAISNLAISPKLRTEIGVQARQHVVDNHSIDSLSRELAILYQSWLAD